MAAFNRLNLHVAVSEADSLHGYFNQSGIPDSHFYVRRSGVVEQMVDTAYNAFADLEGNDATISVETQGTDKGKWTKAQVKTLAELYAWAVKTHGIKLRLATSSKLGASSQGLSWHRLGVNGNFPRTGILRGRNQRGGGMRYSKSYGKTCPGDAKIKQIPGILKAAVKLGVSGGGQSVPSKPSPSKRRLKIDGVLGVATVKAWQKQRKTIQDGVISKPFSGLVVSVQKLITHKNGRGGYKLKFGPLPATGRLRKRDWQAIQKLINLWDKKGKMRLKKGKLKIDGIPGKRTIQALQKSLNKNLWK